MKLYRTRTQEEFNWLAEQANEKGFVFYEEYAWEDYEECTVVYYLEDDKGYVSHEPIDVVRNQYPEEDFPIIEVSELMKEQDEMEVEIIDDPFGEQRRMEKERRKEMNTSEETDKIVTEMWERNYEPTVKDTEWLMREINEVLDGFFHKSTPDVAKFYEVGLREEIGGLIEEMEESEGTAEVKLQEQSDSVNRPSHYNQGEFEAIDVIKDITRDYSGYEGYLVGNIVKYLYRANFKGNKKDDVMKAEKHAKWLVEEMER